MEKLRCEGWSTDDPIKVEYRDGKWWATWEKPDCGDPYYSGSDDEYGSPNWIGEPYSDEYLNYIRECAKPQEEAMRWAACWLCTGAGGYWDADHTEWLSCCDCNGYGKYLVGGSDRLLVRRI